MTMNAVQSASPPRVEILDVGPELARQWLTKEHPSNRHTPTVAAKYAAEMSADAWRWSPEPIVFALDGTLINGANRLRAVVIAGKIIRFTVWFDCPPETYGIIDGGRSRTLFQRDRMAGAMAERSLYQLARTLFTVDTKQTIVPDVAIRRCVTALARPWAAVGPTLSEIRLGRSGMRAGGNLAVCIAWLSDPDATIKFIKEVRDASNHERTPGNAVKIFLRWYDNAKFSSGWYGAREALYGVSSALRQFAGNVEVSYLRPTSDAWDYWRKRSQARDTIDVLFIDGEN